MALDLSDLAALDAPVPSTGAPLLLPVNDIDEDPEQPRIEFDDEALQALAQTIQQRGVRQPVSVRPNAERAGRWWLNFGARRLRAARLAGQASIPAFVDATVDRYDQVLENEQREGLTPLELALFIAKRLRLGESQAEIGRRLGKTRQWVQTATALIDPPDWLLQLYRSGQCRGFNELQELKRLHEAHGEVVTRWAAAQTNVTRDRLATLRTELTAACSPALLPTGPVLADASVQAAPDCIAPTSGLQPPRLASPVETVKAGARSHSTRVTPTVRVALDGQVFELLVHSVPDEPGCMHVRAGADGEVRVVAVTRLTLLGF
ncbi:ParB/RepB/Spo0J family partition protein [Aquincola sp. J276]|uniref:ParB/RepB/Spo0J family partition protein n=1 Tax=Aquincola sp. J276 TaxID=2898432 RepID=UPI0021514090|nr:ParB/RepB/Spo0J family partition protein [Aquincola sp. J276]MCR5864044.1 ParB/RepB/Spo0J family partition protein [Aquincola sp. J276]